ncbi:MAG TPA: glycosyltransferase [Povalibacter sp.]|nr:glycosyltransferase [Povalibacter sp.]
MQSEIASDAPAHDPVMRCLWIGRYMPYPLDAGAKVYSARVAESLAATGAFVRFVGHGAASANAHRSIDWVAVPGARKGQFAGLFSRLPIAAAIDATPDYAALLDAQLHEHWDVLVLDGYGTGWALERCRRYAARRRCVIVHVSHNHEEILWRDMARHADESLPKRIALWLNYLKVRALERRVVDAADLVTAITAEDAEALNRSGQVRTLILTPGYSGPVAGERRITASSPRRAILVGSFRWAVKQENLARFLEVADPQLAANGIGLDIVGDVSEELLATLRPRCRATTFHGFVEDTAPLLAQARIAVVPELIGGGFKLKLLDYLFARVPIATLAGAAAGLPPQLRDQLLQAADLDMLVRDIVSNIDAIDVLNEMQERAFCLAESLFRWEDRGRQLRQAIAQIDRAQRSGAPSQVQALSVLNASDMKR